MKVTNKTLAMTLAAITLFFLIITMSIEGDSGMVIIFSFITGSLGMCSFATWIEFLRERREMK